MKDKKSLRNQFRNLQSFSKFILSYTNVITTNVYICKLLPPCKRVRLHLHVQVIIMIKHSIGHSTNSDTAMWPKMSYYGCIGVLLRRSFHFSCTEFANYGNLDTACGSLMQIVSCAHSKSCLIVVGFYHPLIHPSYILSSNSADCATNARVHEISKSKGSANAPVPVPFIKTAVSRCTNHCFQLVA